MSITETITYHYCCDKCDAVKTEEYKDLPDGWEEDGSDHVCDDCLLNKELKLNLFDEEETY